MVSSLRRNDDPTAEDLGVRQEGGIEDWVRADGRQNAPVLDARDVLENPAGALRLLVDAISVPFDEAMLSWPPGLRATDGVWASHWYGEVARSTSFQTYRPRTQEVPERLREVHARCQECYERLYPLRLP